MPRRHLSRPESFFTRVAKSRPCGGCVFRRETAPPAAWAKRGAPLSPPLPNPPLAIRPHLPQHCRDTRGGRPRVGSSRLPLHFCVPSPDMRGLRQRREGIGAVPFEGRRGRYACRGDERLIYFSARIISNERLNEVWRWWRRGARTARLQPRGRACKGKKNKIK